MTDPVLVDDSGRIRPLDGVGVVSLAVNLPGPLAAARLCELGATVTKVEPPAGDPLGAAAPDWYRQLTSRQQVCRLDIKEDGDRATLDDLLADADLLITSMRPSALARLGLAQPQMTFPALSLIEIVGHAGDRAEVPGHDLNYQAVHGTLLPPAMPPVPIADLLGAERAVSTALAALVRRANTGAGQPYRVVLEDAAEVAGNAAHYLTGPGGVLGGLFPGYGIYQCADGHVALGAVEPHFFLRTLETFGADGTHASIRTAFADKTIAELEATADRVDIPLNGIRSPSTTGR